MLVGLLAASAAPAQTPPWRFHWQPGQVLTYRVEQITSATDVVGDSKSETATKLNNVKRWKVLEVDKTGVATLQLSLQSLRLETKTPSGEALLFDSENLDKSNPQMREQLAKYVGVPLAVLRIDGSGKVIEVKESKFGPASKYESEPPFVLTLPSEEAKAGLTWGRDYVITLEPPQGTGEKFQAAQKYVCKNVANGAATVALTTTLKTQPEAVADRVPLVQVQPEGEVVFDLHTGLMYSARLRIEKELTGHQGEGSSYQFKSTYTEQFIAYP
jgi:hypothetical protein